LEDPDSAAGVVYLFMVIQNASSYYVSLDIVLGLVSLLVLLFFSAMVSGSEIAFFSLNPQQRQQLEEEKSGKSKLILSLLERPKRLLATILISNNFINVAIVILSAFISRQLFDLSNYPILSFIVQVIVITALILLFGEIIPKMYANHHAVRFANIMCKPLQFLLRLFYPLSSVLVNSTSLIDKRLIRKKHHISMSELEDAIDITSDESRPAEETKILKGIVRFGDIEVKEIMKSRMDVVAIDIKTGFRELLNIIVESGYSRIPVYEENFDQIRGILYVKDLLAHLDKKEDFNWSKLTRDAFFVPENKKIIDLLQEFQDKKIHMAIVVDEYGGTSGIATLEDVIEEIVGEINDEFDSKGSDLAYSKLDEKNYVFEGKTSINDFCKVFDIDDDIFDEVKGESDSLAGLILEIEEKIPEKETSIKFRNFEFMVLAADNRRIKRVKVTIREEN